MLFFIYFLFFFPLSRFLSAFLFLPISSFSFYFLSTFLFLPKKRKADRVFSTAFPILFTVLYPSGANSLPFPKTKRPQPTPSSK